MQSLIPIKDKLQGNLENYMSEIIADMWGLKTAKIITDKISNEGLRSHLLSGSLNDICVSEDDGVHPSGEFRIDQLAGDILCK
ncbi:MAG: hypothetical protein H7336_01135 [Bacteriovorax sp.]|nr:hypothetical protein [Bacteriovorax sp.]